jgi:hypothetical protein
MDPRTLIGPSNPLGYPAPFWFIEFFKVLGFTLHTVPMNLWYAGMVLVALLGLRGGAHGRRLAHRIVKAMPIVVALGINLGIVPLLFTQVAYYKVYYPAGILMGWLWFSVIVLLTLAYYGVYLYATSLQRSWRPKLGLAAGWISAILFVVIGFLFANNFSLMTHVAGWPALLRQTGVAGAPTGTALNTADPTLWPRWLMMFGLALTTVAVYVVVDTAFFAGQESDEYRRWAAGFAPKLITPGLVWFAVTGAWYIFGTLPADVRAMLLSRPLVILTVLTALGPGLPWLLIVAQRQGITRRLAFLTGLAQFGVLALNAISRQVVQNAELSRFLDVTAEPVNMQWSPLIVFLVLFVAGLGVVAWMVSKVIAVAGKARAQAG